MEEEERKRLEKIEKDRLAAKERERLAKIAEKHRLAAQERKRLAEKAEEDRLTDEERKRLIKWQQARLYNDKHRRLEAKSMCGKLDRKNHTFGFAQPLAVLHVYDQGAAATSAYPPRLHRQVSIPKDFVKTVLPTASTHESYCACHEPCNCPEIEHPHNYLAHGVGKLQNH